MNEYIKKINEDKEVSEFASKLSKDDLEMNICLLLEQVNANKICNDCKGKKDCLSDVENMQSYLIKNTSFVTREYCDCSYKGNLTGNGLDILYFPEQMELQDLYVNENRKEIINAIQEYKQSDGTKGIYLYGPFGTGKTYIFLSLANYLATKKNKKVIFAYYPELVREAKSSIANGKLESLITKLKNIDVLFLDDFGGELNSSFIRDEFLGPVLQYRMISGLPVFMSSNYDIKSLAAHLSETKDEYNIIKAQRIMERIIFMMKVVKLEDINYRR